MQLETLIFETLHGLVGQAKLLDWLIVFFAEYLGYFLVVGAIIFILRERNWKKGFSDFSFIALAIILSRGLLTGIIRFVFFRPRPFVVLDFEPLFNYAALQAAFPSGHAAFYFALAFGLFVLNKKLGAWYLAAALLMGFARVAAGVHWPLDIVAGALVGLLSVFVVNLLLRSFKQP